MSKDPKVQTLGETENFVIWMSNDPESGEVLYHIELATVTLHFFEDEWDEFTNLILQAIR
ncbi:MAG: hypothetical protein JXA33_27425 [Anaerolineae bacterium]|nr:hypothetical protein [Anaerolineae bacterium]